jgi:hypothetical protein
MDIGKSKRSSLLDRALAASSEKVRYPFNHDYY